MPRVHERIAVARPTDANGGSVRARMPSQVAEIRRLVAGGARPADVAVAYGLCERTIYRYLADRVVDVVIEVAGWRATFATRPDSPPVRVSPWQRC